LVFFARGEGRFYKGFCGKSRVLGGFLMVNLWWNDGEMWCFDGGILTVKSTPYF
jgi:hypothetical protein